MTTTFVLPAGRPTAVATILLPAVVGVLRLHQQQNIDSNCKDEQGVILFIYTWEQLEK